VTAPVSSRTQYRWYLHWEYGLLCEQLARDGGLGGRTEAWIDIGPPLWHWIDEWAAGCASEISEHHAWSLMAEHGNGDLYAPDSTAQYDREVYGRLGDTRDPEHLPPAEPFSSMSEAGRERYVQARREGLSYDDALALGRGHFMLGPVPPALMPDDDDDSDADDR
jgi:hypothetical protein